MLVDNKQKQPKDKGKRKQFNSQSLLEALARAIDGTDQEEAVRLAAEFNDSFGHMVRASVEAESVRDEIEAQEIEQSCQNKPVSRAPEVTGEREEKKKETNLRKEMILPQGRDPDEARSKSRRERAPTSSECSDVRKPRKKKNRRSARKKPSSDSSPSSDSDHSSDSDSSSDDSSGESSLEEDAELCYEITDFESADLPDLPDKWDKGFKKLRSYVPLTLFNPTLLESFYEEDGESKDKSKLAKMKSSLKLLEKQLTYGEFIEMSDLEERYAREIYGLDTYADYVVKHKKIVSDLKKTYNCWMIGLRYHLKVRTVIFRRRKLIKSKVKGKTVLKDKVKIPNGLQPMVERQARHDADRAGDLQYVDNPYAPGGPKFGYNFATGRPPVTNNAVAINAKPADDSTAQQASQRGRRGSGPPRQYVRRNHVPHQRVNRYGYQQHYQPEQHQAQAQLPPIPQHRPYIPYRGPRQAPLMNAHNVVTTQKSQAADTRAM